MKKLFALFLLVSIFIFTGCTKSKLNSISLDEIYTKINNKESFIIYFDGGNDTLKDKLENVLTNNNIEGYVIKTSKISDEEKIKLEPTIYFEDSTIVFIVEGRDPSILTHVTDDTVSLKELELRLKDLKFIEK